MQLKNIDQLKFDFSNWKIKDQLILKEATESLKDRFKDQEFLNKIINSKFTYTDDTGLEILQNFNYYAQKIGYSGSGHIKLIPFYVKWYKPYMKRVRAYVYSGSHPDKIWLNASYPQRNVDKLRGTLGHEIMHLAQYSHGSNKPHGEIYYNSVPCKVGSLLRYS